MLADAPPELPPLRDVIRRFEIAAKRSLGQHFLLDLNLCARIARAAGDLSAVNVIEIGPGPGGLTRALLAAGARSVTAIERDVRCVSALAELAAAYPGRLAIVEANALTIDTAALVPPPRPQRQTKTSCRNADVPKYGNAPSTCPDCSSQREYPCREWRVLR